MKKKKGSGHYCRVCGCVRANEKFSGKGHRAHVCKDCTSDLKRARRAKAARASGSASPASESEDQGPASGSCISMNTPCE